MRPNRSDNADRATQRTLPSCRWVRSRLLAHMDGELGAPDRLAVEAHIAGCSGCSAEMHRLQRSEQALSSLAGAGPHMEDLRPDFYQRLAASSGSSGRRAGWARAAAFAALGLVAVMTVRRALFSAGTKAEPAQSARIAPGPGAAFATKPVETRGVPPGAPQTAPPQPANPSRSKRALPTSIAMNAKETRRRALSRPRNVSQPRRGDAHAIIVASATPMSLKSSVADRRIVDSHAGANALLTLGKPAGRDSSVRLDGVPQSGDVAAASETPPAPVESNSVLHVTDNVRGFASSTGFDRNALQSAGQGTSEENRVQRTVHTAETVNRPLGLKTQAAAGLYRYAEVRKAEGAGGRMDAARGAPLAAPQAVPNGPVLGLNAMNQAAQNSPASRVRATRDGGIGGGYTDQRTVAPAPATGAARAPARPQQSAGMGLGAAFGGAPARPQAPAQPGQARNVTMGVNALTYRAKSSTPLVSFQIPRERPVPVTDLLRDLCRQASVTVIIDSAVPSGAGLRIDGHISPRPLADALNAIASAADLEWRRVGDRIFVTTAPVAHSQHRP